TFRDGGGIACSRGQWLPDNGLLFDDDETGLLHIQEVLRIFNSGRHRWRGESTLHRLVALKPHFTDAVARWFARSGDDMVLDPLCQSGYRPYDRGVLLALPVLKARLSGRARLPLQNEDHLGHGRPPMKASLPKRLAPE